MIKKKKIQKKQELITQYLCAKCKSKVKETDVKCKKCKSLLALDGAVIRKKYS